MHLTRRAFLNSSALLGATVAAPSIVTQALADDDFDADTIDWDGEADLIVAGTGTAIYGALAAAQGGASVMVFEKAGILGGTTVTSGAICWVPGNRHQEEDGYGPELERDEVLSYMRASDVFGNASEEALEDYLDHAPAVFEWAEESLGIPQKAYNGLGDYMDLPHCKQLGRSLVHVDDDGNPIFAWTLYSSRIEPLISSLEIPIHYDTPVTGLVTDSSGRVAGVRVEDKQGNVGHYRANRGVLLGTGGFENNAAMRKAFLRGPVLASQTAAGNVGDAQNMGMLLGAQLANMGSCWQCPAYVKDDSGYGSTIDFGGNMSAPGAILVNSTGKRFICETIAYGAFNTPFSEVNPFTGALKNLPAFQIWDANHTSPSGDGELPAWIRQYETLEELAHGEGIDTEGLLSEVEHFNAMANAGVDTDFHRGEGIKYASSIGDLVENGLAATSLAPIQIPPFYACQVVPATIGTSGGLQTNLDAQVLTTDGSPIEGLYACGNASAGVFGSGYPGAGATVGAGFYRALRAANHALELGLL